MNETLGPENIKEQQSFVADVQLRLLNPEERERFNTLLVEQHYLKSSRLVGEQICYVAEHQGQWVGLLAWSAGSFNLKHREEWIGWTSQQKKRRLSLVVNNSRFLILEGCHAPNLASRIMKLCLERLSQDWADTYGHGALIAESFVDAQKFSGTCYKASGWTLLGRTEGFQRVRQDFYEAHDHPKQLWVRELIPGARTILRGHNQPEALRGLGKKSPAECGQSPEELRKMGLFFEKLTDWRERSSDFKLTSLVVVSMCAILSGVCLGQRDLAAFAANMTPEQMEALKFPRLNRRSLRRIYRPPGETTFFRMLSHLNSRQLEAALLEWQDHVLGKRDPKGDQVAADGKELINSQGMKTANAYSVRDGRWLGSEAVAEGSNEIPAIQELLRRIDIEGSIVTVDAMNTQTETARIIVQEKGGDYLFTVKGNQKGVCENVRQLYKGVSRGFSP